MLRPELAILWLYEGMPLCQEGYGYSVEYNVSTCFFTLSGPARSIFDESDQGNLVHQRTYPT